MKFLIFGDVVGRPGREAVTQALPELRKEYEPDHVIVNIENMAHGVGISPQTLEEAEEWKADAYTTGDHAWDNEQGIPLLDDPSLHIVRPANYPASVSGRGYVVFTSGDVRIAVINLQGQVFFRNSPSNPFHALDQILEQPEVKEASIKLLDFHAEATSEKRGMGWHADGRISAMWGTHTHVPTADAQILPHGTGYITDVGMNGSHHSVIGVDIAGPLKSFLTQTKVRKSFDSRGPREIGALFLDIDPISGRTTNIAHVRKILNHT